jgi:hypothetical protein
MKTATNPITLKTSYPNTLTVDYFDNWDAYMTWIRYNTKRGEKASIFILKVIWPCIVCEGSSKIGLVGGISIKN